jgi:Uncharacterized protein conserved in archaea
MQIHCPVCDYSREVNLSQVPPTAEFATCPKCRHRFRFRAVDLDEVQDTGRPKTDPEHEDVWDAMDSINNRWRVLDERDKAEKTTDARDPSAFASPEDVAIPWENPRHMGYWQSFLRTALWVLFHPANFFGTLNKRPALLPALAFYLLFGCVQYVLNIVWTYILGHMVHDRFVATMGEEAFEHIIVNIFEHSLFTPAVLSVPFQLAMQLLLTTAVVHLLIRLISPHTADFALAFKVVAYASAGFTLALVPVAGSIIAPLWYFGLLLVGCRNAFRMPWNKTIMAMIPLYLLLVFSAVAQYSVFLEG